MAAPPELQIILQIDGGVLHRHELERALGEMWPAASVRSFDDGRAALNHLADWGEHTAPPGLVLISRELPGELDGFEVLRAVRALAHLPELDAIMVCGGQAPEHVAQALDHGAAAYLRKPAEVADYRRFAAQIAAWCQRRHEEKMLRGFCGLDAGRGSPGTGALVTSAAAMMSTSSPLATSPAVATTTANTPLQTLSAAMVQVFDYLTSGQVLSTAGLTHDRKSMQFTQACREAGIEPHDARRKCQDPILIGKRNDAMRRLMSLVWADTELLREFPVSKRTVEEQRAKWKKERKRCGVVADQGR